MAASDPQFVITIGDGKLNVAPLQPGDDASLVFTAKPADAEALQNGTLNLNVAFMQGRAKAAGDMTKLMELLPQAK
ncbi:MAG: sterol transfer family [Actinomycetota bacterium]|jgi:putative sterol carrier protein